MLIELKVSNFAIIDNIHIQFKSGLNILSGETGAGKSILLKSLSLLMGSKASSEMIRSGKSIATIEGQFDLSERQDIVNTLQEMGVYIDEDSLIVRRVLSSQGKSKVYLNGHLATLNDLRKIIAPLIEVTGHNAPLIELTGQHENKNLLSKTYHLDTLDQYCGVWTQRLEYQNYFQRLKEVTKKIKDTKTQGHQREQRLDFLKYQKSEILTLELSSGDEVKIENEVDKLKNSSHIARFVNLAENSLYSSDQSVLTCLHNLMQEGKTLSQKDPTIGKQLQHLEQCKILIEDYLYEVQSYATHLTSNDQDLEYWQKRLSDLRKIQKKYGPSVEEIQKALLDMETEIDELQNVEQTLNTLEKEKVFLETKVLEIGEQLHKTRMNGARLLSDSVNDELLELNMKGTTFHIEVTHSETPNTQGLTHVEFMTQTSANDPPRPLAKVASGGELSRILLSLKNVVGHASVPRTYLFDEVDAGVSGPTAEKVGLKLKTIAQNQQVICITHLPQVAAYGNVHFYICKSPIEDSIQMEIQELQPDFRVKEIARLISGQKITATSLAHAQQLLQDAQ